MNDHGTADDSPPAYDDSKALLLLSTSNLEMPPPVSSAIWSANDTVRSSTSGCILRRCAAATDSATAESATTGNSRNVCA